VIINVSNQQRDLKVDKGSCRTLVSSILSLFKSTPEEVSIYFVSKKKISDLHAQFFQDPTPTDCISFPIDKEHLGEIFVCPKVAIEYAQKKNLNPHRELALYVVHGLLHLLGFDDLEPKQRRIMRKKEKICMNYLDAQKISLS
jgi:probable rRNA maturation factor